MSDKSPLIEAQALAALLQENPAGLKLLDASYNAPNPAYPQYRIGRAQAFDIDEIADPDHALPHMLPSAAKFAQEMTALGISNDDHIVIYDQSGIAMAAARAWWMFRVFGHKKVQVLNGGLPYWHAQGLPLITDPDLLPPTGPVSAYPPAFRAELVADSQAVKSSLSDSSHSVIDVRDAARFSGVVPEARPGLRSGHMPGSVNLPFMALLDPGTGGLKPKKELASLLKSYSECPHITVSCGSGVTACVTALAFAQLGRDDIAVYDGSWTEWGHKDSGMAVKTAAA